MADETAPGDNTLAEEQANEHVKAFFLDLAAKGKDAWNAWRRDRDNEDVRVTFTSVDFSEGSKDQIDFSCFEFGDSADFSRCKWRGVALTEIAGDSDDVFRPGRACFTGTAFGNDARLTGAAFGDNASFYKATFGGHASFVEATFGDWAYFVDTTFREQARFDGAIFGESARFDGATFGDGASFENAAFGRWTVFKQTRFEGSVKFNGRSKSHKEPLVNGFLEISFASARFDGEADFSGRYFQQNAEFANARFYYPPNFASADHANATQIDFTGAYIGFGRPLRLHWTFQSLSQIDYAPFEKSQKKPRTTISNATFISRNAKPSAASSSFDSGTR